MALEYDLVEALRPALVVDLGAGDAVSFFTYCQAMLDHDIDGICYAVDVWENAETHPLASLDAIKDHGRANYPGLHYVVPMPPFEALKHFSEGSIDLLRIDGSRPNVVAGADVEAWFRRVRAGGVIAWHGVAQDPRLFSLIAERCASALLNEGLGLGLARKPGAPQNGELLELLFSEDAAELERFYLHAFRHHELKSALAALRGAQGARQP